MTEQNCHTESLTGYKNELREEADFIRACDMFIFLNSHPFILFSVSEHCRNCLKLRRRAKQQPFYRFCLMMKMDVVVISSLNCQHRASKNKSECVNLQEKIQINQIAYHCQLNSFQRFSFFTVKFFEWEEWLVWIVVKWLV